MNIRRLIAFLCLLLFLGAPVVQAAAPGGMSLEAAFYLNLALNLMQRESVNRNAIDWAALRTATLARAAGAQTYADTYPAIEFALRGLGDGHSFFAPPASTRGGAPAPQNSPDTGRVAGSRFGYLSVGTWDGADPAAYAAHLQRIVQSVERSSPCGWIVDLRGTQTRQVSPILAGVGPILGDGVTGKVLYPSGSPAEWYYRRGAAGLVGTATGQRRSVVQVSRPVVLDVAQPSVAVLTSRRTASGGEAVAIAFRGRPNTRSFGMPTAGLSTHNDAFRLRDGAVLYISTAVLADRTGVRYGGPIPPDVVVEGPEEPKPGVDDALIEAAARWLTIQPSCARAMAWLP